MLLKLATECTYTFNHKFYKQIDGCTMGCPLSVTFSNIYMIKMESEIVIPQKLLFYRRYIDDICNRRKKSKHDELFEKLNNYHPKIKITIEVNATKFWTLVYILIMVSTTLKFIGKQNNLHIGHRKFLKDTNII